jgi:pimeloyl-ACP methyl ester carboxylesterase
MHIVVDDLLTSYSKVGSGKAILLLHGWGDSSHSFAELQKDLAKKFCVIAVDLPGFGTTQAPLVAWHLEDYAKFTKAFLKKLQVDTLHGIIGHSNGGALTIYGLAHGQLVSDRLVLIGAAGIRDRQKTRRLLLKIVAKTGKTATFWLPVETRQKLRKRLYGVAGSDMLLVPHMQETFKQTVRQDVQVEASQLKLPTLLIYGQNDKATPPLFGEIYQQLIKGSQLQIVPDASHFVHHDQPGQSLQLVREFLS